VRGEGKGKLLILDVPRAKKVAACVEVQRLLIRSVQSADLKVAHIVGDRVGQRRGRAVFDDKYAVGADNGGRCNSHGMPLCE
jgi:hypothetical protein